ncbi:MAG: TIR domain-containing protein [Anaerolineae bacterium]|nr:TIR domain-containing protein [Anaerolineae bacterium]
MAHVFISYAPENFEYAEEVQRRLERDGISVWVDTTRPEQVSDGKDWRQELDDAIRAAFALLVISTPQGSAFDYVAYEWTFALGVGVRVIPLLFEPVTLPPRLRGLPALDCTNPARRPWVALLRLLREVQSEHEFNRQAARTPDSLRPMMAAFQSDDPADLRTALASIEKMDDWAARETLVNIMRHPAQNVRTAAALALARSGDSRTVPTLMEALLRGDNREIQTAALRALIEVNPDKMLEIVLDALKDDQKRTRVSAELVEQSIPSHVFLSYSRRDTAMMFRLRDDMQEERILVWTDEALTPGDPSWQVAIENAIESAGCVVVLFSPDAKKSPWVRAELEYARVHNIQIFPLLAAGSEADALPLGYTGMQFLDVRNETLYKAGIPRLITHLQRFLRRVATNSA